VSWWRRLLSRRRLYAELSEEIRQHLEEKVEALLAAGLSRSEAERRARREFGNVALIEERSREVWRWPWLEALGADFRFGLRQFRKAPGFTATAVVILALGIGVNAAIFSLVHHVLIEPLPYPHPERLYAIWEGSEALGKSRVGGSGPDFLDFLEQSRSFSHLAEVIPHFTFTWTGEGEPRLVNCTAASEDFFSLLGIRPYLGRLYEPREYTHLDSDTILVSYRFWKDQLAGDPHVLGRLIHLEGTTQTIVGVLPPLPDLFPDTDVWPTLTVRPSWPFMQWRGNKFLRVMGRVKPGVTPAMAEEDLTGILRRAEGEPADVRVRLVPLEDDLVGSVHVHLEIVMAAVGLVLLIACVNVAALLLARSVKRGAEMALRASLGAGHRRLAQQLMVEGCMLAALAAALGVLAAWAALRLLGGGVPGLQIPRLAGVHLNAAALAATGAVVLAVTLFFSWVPSLAFSGLDLAAALRQGRTAAGRSHRRAFSWLVIAEIACSVVLAVGAGLLLRSFWRVQHVDPGFQPESMLTVYLRTNYYSPKGRGFWKDALDGVAALPGVRAAALADCTPGKSAAPATLAFDDRVNDPRRASPAQGCWISAGFFRTSGTVLLAGRSFDERDGPDAPPVAIVNAEAARRYWPGRNPIGRKIAVSYTGPGRTSATAARRREVVGVVAAIKQAALDLPTEPAVYMPYLQDETSHDMASMNLFVRQRSQGADPRTLASSVRARIHAVRPDQPVEDLRTMEDVMAQGLVPRRYSLWLLGAFAALAVLLAALGVYGVAAYTTLQRTPEFGVRMALGATRGSVMSRVFRQGLALTAAGAAAGAGLAAAAARTLSQLLFEVQPLDPLSFAAAVALLALVSLVACLLPAWRAARVDPAHALRSE
jgi:putative ABC transport system permease protein